MKFEAPKENNSIIKVIGVGGGGSNAVSHMYREGINGVDFAICNTDQQSLDNSPVMTKIQLGSSLTEGRGAGAIAEVGKNAAIENIEDIKAFLEQNTKMVFITAGMGGGTGTGAAPIIAATAKEMGILTVGIVTIPFSFEGRKRKEQANKGIEEMRDAVDTLIIICNDRIREMYGNLSISNAFTHADNVLATAAKGIAEIITSTGAINVDFEDVRTVMSNSGVAIMGSAEATGENRAINAIEEAISSPLLNDNNIKGANYVLLNITYGDEEIQMDEIVEITDFIQNEAGESADIIWGHGYDASLADNISVTLIATGFDRNVDMGYLKAPEPKKKVINLDESSPKQENSSSHSHGNYGQIQVPKYQNPSAYDQAEENPSPHVDKSSEPFIKKTIEPQNTSLPTYRQALPTGRQDSPTPEKENTNEDQPEYLRNQRVIEFDMDDTRTYPNESQANNNWEEGPKMKQTSSEPSTPSWSNTSVEKIEDSYESESPEVRKEKIKERLNRLRDLSMKLKAPSGLAELESEPAYKRRDITIEDGPTSKTTEASRYTLSEEDDPINEGEKKYSIKENNSFLHDNVD